MTDRLDRIEGILEQVAQQQQSNTAAIGQLTERQQILTERVDQLTGRIDQLTGQVDQLTVSVEELTNQGDALVEAVSGAFAEMRDDRLEWKAQMEQDRQVFQAEIRRIWEYLLAQSGNGRGGN